jgi:hypothetical protein
MAVSKEFMSNLKKWQDWETRVNNMETFTIPNHYKAKSANGKYERFTGYLKEWTFGVMAEIKANASSDSLLNFEVKHNNMDDFWNHALSIANGNKNIKNDLPKLQFATEENKRVIYDNFLPAYRALKERFEKRSVFQWIFNHSQYVAERDSIKALESVITTLTGEGKYGLENELKMYQDHMPTSDTEKAIEHETARIAKEKGDFHVNNTKAEKSLSDTLKKEETQSTVENIKVDYKKPTKSEDFLEIGYIPDIQNIEQEWELMKPLYEAVENKELLIEDTPQNKAAKEILDENYIRLTTVQSELKQQNGVQRANDFLNGAKSRYLSIDANMTKNFAGYVPPKVSVGKINEYMDMSNEELEKNIDELDMMLASEQQSKFEEYMNMDDEDLERELDNLDMEMAGKQNTTGDNTDISDDELDELLGVTNKKEKISVVEGALIDKSELSKPVASKNNIAKEKSLK